jgi:hypothetical protein
MRAVYFAALIGTALLTISCHRSGTWSDDPKNWGRAFGERTPTNTMVVHSLYWRSAHWSLEYGYFFEVRGAVRKELLSDTNLVRVDPNSRMEFFSKRPSWFVPKSYDAYEVWGYTNDPPSKFRLLIDKTDETTFFADFQL